MKCKHYFLFFIAWLSCVLPETVNAQESRIRYRTAQCEASFINENTMVRPRFSPRMLKAARTETSSFDVQYDGFSPEAQAAFEYAISIWDALIDTPVPIKVNARWISLGSNALGSAIWGEIEKGFEGAQDGFYYPISLAEKIAGIPLNPEGEADITANFSLDAAWYFGLDGATPDGKVDLVSVVLHEIGHGLGISASFTDNPGDQRGFFGLLEGLPIIYDRFVSNSNGEILIDSYETNTLILHIQLISESLFFDSPIAKNANGNLTPRIYAPNPFSGGSSIAHLDESTYPAGNENSLMTPQIGFAEGIHDPGPIILNMMAEMGWIHTYFDHTPVESTEVLEGDVPIISSIVSDTDLIPEKMMLHYSTDGFSSEDVAVVLTDDGNDQFSATVPATGSDQSISYYLEVSDLYDRVYREPKTGFHEFSFGVDTENPEIQMDVPQFVFASEDVLALEVEVTDSYGIAQVQISFEINEGITELHDMIRVSGTNNYQYVIDLSGFTLSDGDKIEYRITATDKSAAANTSTFPASGNQLVPVRDYGTPVNSYTNNFNEPSNDFVGYHFSITQPEGFINPGIHSDHPYLDGTGEGYRSDYYYTLLTPIILKPEGANIDFDEIVLVEPHADGIEFGQEAFNDYVIVEGSRDGGLTWEEFEDGYDSKDEPEWLSTYNSVISNSNSEADGVPTLFNHRTIDMLGNLNFEANDEVIVRFRLFADRIANGWGWAIDNLVIQDDVLNRKEPLDQDFLLYPNPVVGSSLHLKVSSSMPDAVYSIQNLQGVTVSSGRVHLDRGTNRIDVGSLPSGIFILHVSSEGRNLRSRFIISR